MGGKLVSGFMMLGLFCRFGVYSAPAATEHDHQATAISGFVLPPGFVAVAKTTTVSGKTTTAVIVKTITPAVGKTTTAAIAKTNTPAVGKTTTAASAKTTTPAFGKTTAVASTKTTTPAVGKTTTAAIAKTTTPAAHKTTTPAAQKTTTAAIAKTTTPAAHNTTTAPIAKNTAPPPATTGAKSAPDQTIYVKYQHFTGNVNCDSDYADIIRTNILPWTCSGVESNCGDTNSCFQMNTNVETVQYYINCNSDCSSCGYVYPVWYDNQCTTLGVLEGNSALASYLIYTNNYSNFPGVQYDVAIYSSTSCDGAPVITFNNVVAGTCGTTFFGGFNTGDYFSGYEFSMLITETDGKMIVFSSCNFDCTYCYNMWIAYFGSCSTDGVASGYSFSTNYNVPDRILTFSTVLLWEALDTKNRRRISKQY
ncbi:hypothetical protein BDK51DRAFT_34432 [Blyttiomyces helicus]|uniref:Uncharacterized protein n=1 Tax=Blyttiomyces helicus TaxID=388810 RepID=A0A4P9WQI5_9FUNG|nr:hypothetical protein BDK51DRAFT_34432 [Blyttiomyces helicus]|eukprot:RKO94433.1 hypothetical protein BDK51DRAFT_34432 [Blyttiomyces helicus]